MSYVNVLQTSPGCHLTASEGLARAWGEEEKGEWGGKDREGQRGGEREIMAKYADIDYTDHAPGVPVIRMFGLDLGTVAIAIYMQT